MSNKYFCSILYIELNLYFGQDYEKYLIRKSEISLKMDYLFLFYNYSSQNKFAILFRLYIT